MLVIPALERVRQEDLSWRLVASATQRVQRQMKLLETLSQMAKRKEKRGRGVLEHFHDMILVKKWIHALNFISRGKHVFQTNFISWWKCTTPSRLELDSDKLYFLLALRMRIEPRTQHVLDQLSISSSRPFPFHKLSDLTRSKVQCYMTTPTKPTKPIYEHLYKKNSWVTSAS